MAGLIHGELMPKLSPEESNKTIIDLERMKEFEMEKVEISRIDLKKPVTPRDWPHHNYSEGGKTGQDYPPPTG